MAATIISAVIAGIVAITTAIVGSVVSNSQFQQEQKNAKELNEQNREYELEDQATLFEREDTAIQRKMQDMKNAGINPLMSVISGGSQASMQSTRNTSAMPTSIADIIGNNITGAGSNISAIITNTAEKVLDQEKRIAEIDKIKGETSQLEQDILRTKVEMETFKEQKINELKTQEIGIKHIEQTIEESKNKVQVMLDAEQRAKLDAISKAEMQKIEKEIKEEELKLKKHENEMTETEKEEAKLNLEIKKQNKIVQVIDSIMDTAERLIDIKDRLFRFGSNKRGKKTK